jgi:hypothetical protein
MNTTTQKRAKTGGEFGANGDWYEGGKFIATTEQPKGKPAARKARRVQVEPYTWVESDGVAIFGMVGTQAEYIDRYNPKAGIRPNVAGCNYYGSEYHGQPVAALCERFNNGERWV